MNWKPYPEEKPEHHKECLVWVQNEYKYSDPGRWMTASLSGDTWWHHSCPCRGPEEVFVVTHWMEVEVPPELERGLSQSEEE